MAEELAKIYQSGNAWERKVYLHMAKYLERKGVTRFGATVSGNEYKHWLREEDAGLNFITPEIHKATIDRFKDHKAGDLKRILTNTAASQPLCFNLIIFLQQHPALADGLFSDLLGKKVTVVHLEPEFTPYTGKVLPERNEKTSDLCHNLPGFEPTNDESIGD